MGRLLVVCVFLASSVDQARPADPSLTYKGARLLCAEHVNAGAIHIIWQSHATTDPVDTVVAHYERVTGQKATVRADGQRDIELTADHHVSIYPAAKNDVFPFCGVKPTTRERTVIRISEAARQLPGGPAAWFAVGRASRQAWTAARTHTGSRMSLPE